MRKASVVLSVLVLAALFVAACGGGATSTNVVESPPPVTMDATEDMGATATESPTEEGAATQTAGVPVTGDVNPARLSNQLDFTVWSQDGEQIGDVNDMVLDLDNSRVAYVVVGTGGFLDLGERELVVPWDQLQLQTGTGDTTGGQQNAFILQTDLDMFRNAPDFDLSGNLPEMGQTAGDWDADVRTYWDSGGTTGGMQSTPAAGETATTPDATAEGTAATGTGGTTMSTDQATSTAGTDSSTAPRTGQGQALQGVVLATEVIGSTVNFGAQGMGTDQATAPAATEAGTSDATATPGATADSTATTDAGGTGTGTDQGPTTGTIEDMIVDVDAGEILYFVITGTFAEGERWIPVPLGQFQWDASTGAFGLNADSAMLQNAPSLQNGLFPDTTTSGWNAEFDTFWQSNSGTGIGTGSGTGAGMGTGTGTDTVPASPTP